MKMIPLNKGKFALVDDEDYEQLSQRRWYLSRGYAVSGSRPTLRMHRVILGEDLNPGLVSDHINRDKLDNQRSNLRAVTQAQNCANRTKQDHKKYLGVKRKNAGFTAQVQTAGKDHYLGLFKSEEDAALAYNRGAIIHHGIYANLNDVIDDGRDLTPNPRVPPPIRPVGESGLRGVSPHKGKWRARAHHEGREKYLGTFPTPEEASAAYEAFIKKL